MDFPAVGGADKEERRKSRKDKKDKKSKGGSSARDELRPPGEQSVDRGAQQIRDEVLSLREQHGRPQLEKSDNPSQPAPASTITPVAYPQPGGSGNRGFEGGGEAGTGTMPGAASFDSQGRPRRSSPNSRPPSNPRHEDPARDLGTIASLESPRTAQMPAAYPLPPRPPGAPAPPPGAIAALPPVPYPPPPLPGTPNGNGRPQLMPYGSNQFGSQQFPTNQQVPSGPNNNVKDWCLKVVMLVILLLVNNIIVSFATLAIGRQDFIDGLGDDDSDYGPQVQESVRLQVDGQIQAKLTELGLENGLSGIIAPGPSSGGGGVVIGPSAPTAPGTPAPVAPGSTPAPVAVSSEGSRVAIADSSGETRLVVESTGEVSLSSANEKPLVLASGAGMSVSANKDLAINQGSTQRIGFTEAGAVALNSDPDQGISLTAGGSAAQRRLLGRTAGGGDVEVVAGGGGAIGATGGAPAGGPPPEAAAGPPPARRHLLQKTTGAGDTGGVAIESGTGGIALDTDGSVAARAGGAFEAAAEGAGGMTLVASAGEFSALAATNASLIAAEYVDVIGAGVQVTGLTVAALAAEDLDLGSGRDVTIFGTESISALSTGPLTLGTDGFGSFSTGDSLSLLSDNVLAMVGTASATLDGGSVSLSSQSGDVTVTGAKGITLDAKGPAGTSISAPSEGDLNLRSTSAGVKVSAGQNTATAIELTAAATSGGVKVRTGGGGMTIDGAAGPFTTSAGAVSIRGLGKTTTIENQATGNAQDLLIALTGTAQHSSRLRVTSTGIGTDALFLQSSRGGIAQATATAFSVTAGTSALLSAETTADVASNTGDLTLRTANGRAILKSSKTDNQAVLILAEATSGGVDITSGTAGRIDLEAGTGGAKIDTTGALEVCSRDSTLMKVDTTSDSSEMTLAKYGYTESGLNIISEGTQDDAIQLCAESATGGIRIKAGVEFVNTPLHQDIAQDRRSHTLVNACGRIVQHFPPPAPPPPPPPPSPPPSPPPPPPPSPPPSPVPPANDRRSAAEVAAPPARGPSFEGRMAELAHDVTPAVPSTGDDPAATPLNGKAAWEAAAAAAAESRNVFGKYLEAFGRHQRALLSHQTFTSEGYGKIEMEAGTGGIDVDSYGSITIDSPQPSHFKVNSNETGDDLTIGVTGATDSSVIVLSEGTGIDAIRLDATAASSGIVVNSGTAGVAVVTAGTYRVTSTGAFNTVSTSTISESAVGAISMTSTAGGISRTAAGNIADTSSAGKITLTTSATGTGGDIVLTSTAASTRVLAGGTGNDAVEIKAQATSGGIDVATGSAGKINVQAGTLGMRYGSTGTGEFSTSGVGTAGDITVLAAASSVTVTGGEAVDDAVLLQATDALGGIVLTAGTSGMLDMDAGTQGAFLDATGPIKIGTDNVHAAIHVGTQGERHIDVGSSLAASLEGRAREIHLLASGPASIDATDTLDLIGSDNVNIGSRHETLNIGADVTETILIGTHPKVRRVEIGDPDQAELHFYGLDMLMEATEDATVAAGERLSLKCDEALTINSKKSSVEVFSAGHSALSLVEGRAGFGVRSPMYPIHMASGAHVTTGGVWTDASSRALKDNITSLSAGAAAAALASLEPVTFEYKAEPGHVYPGFIAEDVPAIVAMPARDSLSPMKIVAVLTRVVKDQGEALERARREGAAVREQLRAVEEAAAGREREVRELRAAVEALQAVVHGSRGGGAGGGGGGEALGHRGEEGGGGYPGGGGRRGGLVGKGGTATS